MIPLLYLPESPYLIATIEAIKQLGQPAHLIHHGDTELTEEEN
jgi:hypothetical protein